MRDPVPYFQSHPLFADRADAAWFLARAWNNVPPAVGVQRGESIIHRESRKFVVLHRYGEGVIFNSEGACNSPGFLANMLTLPEGMLRQGDNFVVDPDVLAQAPHLPGASIVFYNGNLQNYYHWIVDAMLALYLLDTRPRLAGNTVLPAHLPQEGGFDHVGIMRLLGHDALTINRISAPFVRCDTVIYLDRGEIERYPSSRLRAFQANIATRYGDGNAGNRILVRRRDLRSLANQEAIEGVLEPLGFRSYLLEEMTAEEQIRLFAGASFVVSPHGAGLSNLVFAPPNCKVIELMPASEMRPFFWEISAKLGHAYGMLPCVTLDGGFNGHLDVDIEKFRALLDMVTAQR